MTKEKGTLWPIDLYAYGTVKRRYARRAVGSNIARVLAIDPGTTNLAACLLTRGFQGLEEQVLTTKFEVPKFETIFERIKYLELALRGWMLESDTYILRHGISASIDLMIKESVSYGSAFGVADAGRVQHALESMASDLEIPLIDVTPMAMRSYIGSKSKSDTKLMVYKKFGREFPSEDETDVYAIAKTGVALITGEYKPKTKK